MFVPLTQAAIDKIVIDEGYIVLDYGIAASELALGPTRGGGEFSVEPSIRDIEFDGKKGKTKGMQVVEEMSAKLKVSTLLCSQDSLAAALFDSNYPSQEMVTNGAFTGGSTGWTLGSGWAYGTNAVAHTTGTAAMTQSQTVVSGRTYRLSFALTRSAGDLTVTMTNATGTSGALITAGTKTVIFKATATGAAVLTFTPSTDFAGTVDDVSLKCTTIYSSDVGLIPTTKYRTNVTMFAKCADGTYKKITLFNPMHEGAFTFAAKPKSENEHALEFVAHFDPTEAATTTIYQIDEIAAFPEA